MFSPYYAEYFLEDCVQMLGFIPPPTTSKKRKDKRNNDDDEDGLGMDDEVTVSQMLNSISMFLKFEHFVGEYESPSQQ